MRFLDLFAGIGGFHQAMLRVDSNSRCISAVEFNTSASNVYHKTYNVLPLGDITDIEVLESIDDSINSKGKLDILFAGFPCQTFSKAGKQEGFDDQTRGTLFFSIKELLLKYKPSYFVLENVRNLLSHKSNDIKSFEIILDNLREIGYNVQFSVLSPHKFNKPIPQMRDRVFIYGSMNKDQPTLDNIKDNIESKFKGKINLKNTTIKKYIDVNFDSTYKVEIDKELILNSWEIFVKYFKNLEKLTGTRLLTSPIWTDVFYDNDSKFSEHPWKQNIIDRNLKFYNEHKTFIDIWYKTYKIKDLGNAARKLEWNANSTIDSIFKGIIQFRPSGIRVKRPDFFPTFVAINHKPIIGWQKRYITPTEISKLYGFKDLDFTESLTETYKQLGNTISVDVAEVVIKELIKE